MVVLYFPKAATLLIQFLVLLYLHLYVTDLKTDRGVLSQFLRPWDMCFPMGISDPLGVTPYKLKTTASIQSKEKILKFVRAKDK